MRVAVCYNQAPVAPLRGAFRDLIADHGTAAEAAAVLQALQRSGHHAETFLLGDDPLDFAERLREFLPEAVFNLCEGFRGDARQEMNVAGLLELLRLPYTGCPSLCLGLTQDKARTKDILLRHGLPSPRYLSMGPGERIPPLRGLEFPLFVKPRFEDASFGIDANSVIEDESALLRQVRYIHEVYRQPALVEEYIDGRELNVAILGQDELMVLPVAEIRFEKKPRRPILCFEGKWALDSRAYRTTTPVCPARLTSKQDLLVRDVALRAFKLLGCRDYARVDIRLRANTPMVLEVNANPDISPEAGLARAARVAGLDYPVLVERILNYAAGRKEKSHAPATQN